MSRENVTLGDIDKLAVEIRSDPTIGHWKKVVKAFAVKFGLTDMEAIRIAQEVEA